jgi:hypothetical protein
VWRWVSSRLEGVAQCVVSACVGCNKVLLVGVWPVVRCVVWTRFYVLNAV